MKKEEEPSNRRFSDLWVVSRGMGERNGEKIDISYFLNRLLQRLLSPSILHTAFIILTISLYGTSKDNKYLTSNRNPVGYSSCLDSKASSGYPGDDRCYLGVCDALISLRLTHPVRPSLSSQQILAVPAFPSSFILVLIFLSLFFMHVAAGCTWH